MNMTRPGFELAPYGDCSFCRDIAGTRECAIVAETELAIAQVNLRQYERGAMLVTPRAHRETVLEIREEEICATYLLAQRVARAAAMAVASLVGRDRVALLPRLLTRLRCLVSGDTGVAHLAAAVGVATVTLFGPSDRRLTAPRGAAARVIDREVPCAPCFRPTCPIDHICLARIEPEAVRREVKDAVA